MDDTQAEEITKNLPTILIQTSTKRARGAGGRAKGAAIIAGRGAAYLNPVSTVSSPVAWLSTYFAINDGNRFWDPGYDTIPLRTTDKPLEWALDDAKTLHESIGDFPAWEGLAKLFCPKVEPHE